jgi:adenylate cyclase
MHDGRVRQLSVAILISLTVFAGLVLLRAFGALQPLELLAYDLALSLNSTPRATATSPIVLVAITEDDIRASGSWPISDGALSNILTTLDSYQPRAIGLDIYRDVPVPPGSDAFEHTLQSLRNVIAIYKFHSSGSPGVGPPRSLAGSDRTGFSDIVLDPGGVVRRGLAFVDDGEQVGVSFALRLALAYLATEGIELRPASDTSDHFMLGRTTFVPIEPNHGSYVDADTSGYQFMVDYADLDAGFERYTIADVLADRVPRNALRDRIVILGVVAVSVKDAFATPRGQWSWVADPGMPGIALHGTIVEQLVRAATEGRPPMSGWPTLIEYAVLFLACVSGGLIGLQSRSAGRLLVIATAGVALSWGAGFLYFVAGVWTPIVPVATGWVVALALVTGYLVQRERHDRAILQRMFAAQTSKDVAETLWKRRHELLEEGGFRPQTLEATVLFVDLAGFTGVSERLPPDALMRWIHRFMEVATRTVVDHGGMVDDYFGDGLKANFGAPFARNSEAEIAADADAAVRCALALQAEVPKLNRLIDSSDDEPTYAARIGIHSGTVVVGGIGNAERQKYTSIGDTVNVAARLESFGKELSGRGAGSIVVSDATAALLHEAFRLRAHGRVTLRGRASSINVFEVLGPRAPDGTPQNEAQERMSEARG